jgi:hypothetical protein
MFKNLFFVSILCVFCISFAAHADVSPELLQNSSFTKALSSQPGWTLYGNHNAQSVTQIETQNGAPVLHVIDKDSSGETGIKQTIPAEAGQTYQAEVEIKATKPYSTIGAFLQIRFLPSQKFEQVGLENIVPDSSWQNVTARATAPVGTTQIQIFVYTHAAEQPDFLVKSVSLKSGFSPVEKMTIPDPIPPQYTKLKSLYSQTTLVQNGKAVSAIVVPDSGRYKPEAQALQKVLLDKTGVSVPIISDANATIPLMQNLILLGNRSTNKTLSKLYDLFYALTDLKYPGIGGYEVRSVSNPFGNGYNAIILGGSDDAGVQVAAQHFIKVLSDQKDIKNSFSVGWLLDVKTGQKVLLPANGAGLMPTWQDSKSYGSTGYFGWNSISKNEALYYMTGDPQYAREFLRLAFPDTAAKKDIDKIDGERIENKNDPLAGPYHYNATRMILFWDLIEESPVFTDAERLKVTNAFSRQLAHRVDEWTGKHIYALAKPAISIGSRHDSYSALSMYTLARYFERDYPGPIWKHVLQASGDFYFAPLEQAKPWIAGENDNLFWYDTGLAPVLDYMILSGDHRGVQSGALDFLLKNQQVLWDGSSADRNLSYAALDYLNKAVYLTNDGRWITYRERLPLDTSAFRLGQSFWPDASLKAAQPDDLLDKWTGWFLTPAQIASRGTGFAPQQSFENLSYRTAPDDTGDFILLDGMNGESRNPYHTFALLDLRVHGKTLLKGYLNQVRTTADGTVEPKVPLDAALQKYFSMGESTFASADVPNLPYCDWQRGVYLRAGRYALAIDKLKFKTNSQHFEAEFWWQAEGSSWKKENGELTAGDTRLATADSLYTEILGNPIKQLWDGAVKQSEEKYFFSLIAPNAQQQKISGVRVAPNAAVFAAPETILVSTNNYKNVNAEVALRSEKYFFSESLQSAPGITVSSPIDIDWDNAKGILNINAVQKTKLILNLAQAKDVTFDGKKIQIQNQQISLSLAPGKHIFTGVFMANTLKSTFEGVDDLLAKTPKPAAQKPASDVPQNLPALTQNFTISLPESITQIIAVSENSTVRYYAAAGKIIYALDADGKILRQFDAPSDVTKIHWWPQAQLLIAGMRDQKVLAFSPDGNLKWTFQSEMDPAVYAAGKTYWFNTAPGHGGIHGLDSGVFLNHQSQLFVGSACTLEILDADGKLIKRLPQFWGPPALFQLISAADGSVNLLAARDITDNPSAHIINSKTLDPAPYGYNGVPSGYDPIGGWIDQRRMHFFYVDLNGDGKKEIVSDITGVWNRISTWDVDGNPLSSIYFGPGDSPYKGMNAFAPSLIRGTDVADIDGDSKLEIVTALSNGLIVALDGNCHIKWSRRVSGVPSALKIVGKTIAVGQEDGIIITLDGKGTFLLQSKTSGAVNGFLESQNSLIAVGRKDIAGFHVP